MQLSRQLFFNLLKQEYQGDDSLVARWRKARLAGFLACVKPPSGARILDMGGSALMWNLIEHDFKVTLVNLPGNKEQVPGETRYEYIEDDATDLRHRYADQSFDVVFSNSVIEHVGGEKMEAAFASEARRIGNGYWIQTPSPRFPIEVHTGVPFYWFYPEFVRTRMKNSWRKTLPEWTDMVEGTRALSRRRLKELFPDAQFYVERKFGFEKSNAAYRPFRPSAK